MPAVPSLPRTLLDDVVNLALAEDLGRAGDVTSAAMFKATDTGQARIIAREDGCVAGIDLVTRTFACLDEHVHVALEIRDGADVEAGTVLATLQGPVVSLLAGERTALNFVGHLSGVATATRNLVALAAPHGARVAATRKTMPGLRALQKYAVRCGGGLSHRYGLDDAILIKDNHIAAAGGVAAALERALAFAGHVMVVQIEVDTLAQLREVIAFPVHAVLLDNMSPDTLREAVRLVNGRCITEASGGITADTIEAVAATGVDVISVGWITHSAPNMDVAMDWLAS